MFWIFLIIYFLIGLLFFRCLTFTERKPGDMLLTAFIWPYIIFHFVAAYFRGEVEVTYTRKKDREKNDTV